MARIDFRFRDQLNAIAGGAGHNYCYQCGACVGDCPAAQYSTRGFNPRLIVLRALLGLEDELLGEDTVLWECTNCFTCWERCPQEVKPIDVIIALKNMAVQRGTAPDKVTQYSEPVMTEGHAIAVSGITNKRREQLGLQPIGPAPVDELAKILPPAANGGEGEP